MPHPNDTAHMDLAEFVSDYLRIDGAAGDTDMDIAEAFAERNCIGKWSTEALDDYVEMIAKQVDYYRS